MNKFHLFQLTIASVFNLIFYTESYSQETKRVLFIGNSYIATNNLPNMLATLALTTGDTIIYDGNTPGGNTLMGHYNNATTIAKIQQGNWDYVVLQEQSLYPAFPINQVNSSVFPYAKKLDSLIHLSNPCAKTLFYMTWGRKNGDSQNCPYYTPLCTYEGMDNLLRERYMMMVQQNNAMVSPVGPIWRYLRTNHPEIELYQSDESHPSVAGTYAAACGFYASILRKDPTLITATSGLSQDVATKIRNAAKLVVLDSLSTWKINTYDPMSSFTFSAVDNTVAFQNQSTNADSYLWNFGDGTTSSEENPVHIYSSVGNYNVQLTVTTCNDTHSNTQTVSIASVSIKNINPLQSLTMAPNPVNEHLKIHGFFSKAQLVDAMGRVLMTTDYTSTIDFKHINPGTYFILFELEGYVQTQQLIKR